MRNPGLTIYYAARHGVLGPTESAALGDAASGVCLAAACPGTIDTPSTVGDAPGQSSRPVSRSWPRSVLRWLSRWV